jgi:hypothetical protein
MVRTSILFCHDHDTLCPISRGGCLCGGQRETTRYKIFRVTLTSCPFSFVPTLFTAFRACKSLTNVTLSNKVKSIGCGTFLDCIQLQHIQLPYHLQRLESSMFANCPQLTSVTCVEFDNNDNNETMRNNESTTTAILPKASSTTSADSNNHRRSLFDDDDDDEDDNDLDYDRSCDSIQLPPKLLSIGTLVRLFPIGYHHPSDTHIQEQYYLLAFIL